MKFSWKMEWLIQLQTPAKFHKLKWEAVGSPGELYIRAIGFPSGHYITHPNNALLWEEIPQNYHRFVLFDNCNVGNLMTLGISLPHIPDSVHPSGPIRTIVVKKKTLAMSFKQSDPTNDPLI